MGLRYKCGLVLVGAVIVGTFLTKEGNMRTFYQVVFKAKNRYVFKRFEAEDFASAVEFCEKANGKLRIRSEKLRVNWD